MTADHSAYLIDTNVLVYAYDPAYPEKQATAMAVLDGLRAVGLATLSVQVLGEFFNTVTRKIAIPLNAAEAETRVTHLARSLPVLDLTRAVVLEAVRGARRFQFSYWDALIWATAKLNELPYVLSEDFSDGSLIEDVRFLNPFTVGFDLGLVSKS